MADLLIHPDQLQELLKQLQEKLAARQLRSLAADHGAEIVILKDRTAHLPNRLLAYKHWSALHDYLTAYQGEAGRPKPREMQIYGSPNVCAECGRPLAQGRCERCGLAEEPEYRLAKLLAWQTLRDRAEPPQRGVARGPLGAWMQQQRQQVV